MNTLPQGSDLCEGAKSPINPGRPLHICVECLRRLTVPMHSWAKYIQPIPARRGPLQWECSERVQA